MWPWGHVAVGYLAYSLASRASGRRVGGPAVIAVAVGTQFPDLVDKPLGWTFGVLPGGRTLAHSLLTVALVTAVVLVVARRYRRSIVAAAFLVGYLSHLFADGLYSLLEREFADLTYLLWPIFPAPEPEVAKSFLAHFAGLSVDPHFLFEVSLFCLATVLWHADRRPGLTTVRARLRLAREWIATAVGS